MNATLSNPPATTAARLSAAGGLAALVTGSAVVWYFDPTKANFFPVCPMYALTGLACPGCGLTRGFHALFHGDIVTALDYNALIPVFLVILAGVLVSLASVAVRGRGLVRLDATPKFIVSVFVLLIVFGVVRNLPYYPFSVLFP